jgi:hypothetical protein
MRYRTKYEWAAAQAAALRQQAWSLPMERSADWQAVRRRMRAQASLRDEALRFERLAERLKSQGR